MMDKSLFDSPESKHEYALPHGQRWGLLSEEARKNWLGWIEAGPAPGSAYKGETSAEDPRRIAYWKYERLHWVREHIVGDWKHYYDEMHVKYGEPELADMHVRSSIRWGHDSPVSVEELRAL